VKVMLRYPRDERRSLSTLETMRVRTAEGLEIPFTRVAEMKVGKSFSAIRRVNRQRALNITADADKKSVDVEALRQDITRHMEEFMRGHPQVKWSFEGEARAERESNASTLFMVAIILFGLYTLTAIPFKSYFMPLVVLVVIPFGVVGAVLGHLFHNLPISMMSMFGMLAVSGVVVNDTLVLVDEINHRRQTDGVLTAVRDGGAARFRAIFLTQITTFFGLVPLIFDGTWIAKIAPFFFSQGAQSTHAQFLTPVSVGMGYGSLFATIICLYLVPMCYMALDDLKQALSRWWSSLFPAARSNAESLPEVEA
jgi:multidrug efflux pump subunit AcrB